MNLNSETIKLAGNKKFTEFSDAIKQELKTKISNHETSKNYSAAYDNIQRMKDLFSQIAK